MKKNKCIECKEREIFIKKRSLCYPCYQRLREAGMTGKEFSPTSSVTIKKIKQVGEINFIKNFFTNDEWIYEPCMFYLSGERYTPDFYDKERNVFIEVSATRQAYHYNKEKYDRLAELFPKILFEVRTPDGVLLGEGDNGKWDCQTKDTVDKT